jgi:DNA-binding transcriptional LysR family regulator
VGLTTAPTLIDVQRLQAFVAVAERLNFTRASEYLGVAQQLLSQKIARLERDLGCACSTATRATWH